MNSLELFLHAATLNHPPLEEHIKLAADSGFDGISFRANEYFLAKQAGGSEQPEKTPEEIRQLFYDASFYPGDVDCVVLDPSSEQSEEGQSQNQQIGERLFGVSEDEVLQCGAELNARAVNLILLKNEIANTAGEANGSESTSEANGETNAQTTFTKNLDSAVQSVSQFADKAASHGLLVQLEPIPLTGVETLWQALDLVVLANRENLGVQLDAWHFFRGPDPDLEKFWEITAPEKIFSIQMCDGALEAPFEPQPESLDGPAESETPIRRLLPGEGDFDLAGLLSGLDEIGVIAPISLEVFSEELNQLEPGHVAAMASEAMQDVVFEVFK